MELGCRLEEISGSLSTRPDHAPVSVPHQGFDLRPDVGKHGPPESVYDFFRKTIRQFQEAVVAKQLYLFR